MRKHTLDGRNRNLETCADGFVATADYPLATSFLTTAPVEWESGAHSLDRLESVLSSAVDEAKAKWCGIDVPIDEFVAFVGPRVPATWPIEEAIKRSSIADLWLVFACIKGHSKAIAAMAERIECVALSACCRLGMHHEDSKDIAQDIQERFLVGDGKTSPRMLEQFAGSGSLKAWLRMVIIREALRRKKRVNARHEPLEDVAFDDLCRPMASMELAHLKSEYGPLFRMAFRKAVEAMSERDKNILRLHLRKQLKAKEIGHLYGVHRGTIARWLSEIRAQLLDETRREMCRQTAATEAEVDSALAVIGSRLDASFSELLAMESVQRPSLDV